MNKLETDQADSILKCGELFVENNAICWLDHSQNQVGEKEKAGFGKAINSLHHN